MKSISLLIALATLAIGLPATAGEEKYTRVDEGNLVDPLFASYVGSPGTEWLSGGGFQSDGRLVLAGVTIGPEFQPGNVTVRVLGPDGPAPSLQEWPIKRDHKGNPRLDKEGKPRLDRFQTTNPAATGFILRLSPDFQTIESASRLPWKAGNVYACSVGRDGAIYLAGTGEKTAMATLCKNLVELDASLAGESKNKSEKTAYLAKLSKEGDEIEWIRLLTARQDLPGLRVLKNGHILFKAATFSVIDSDGKLVSTVPGNRNMNPKNYAYNEQSGEFAYGHEHHWPTGREPWRCPELKTFNPDGSVKDHLYDWPGPLVGITREVSDSAIKNLQYLDDGDLLFTAWSDGGNSVMYRQPFAYQQWAWDQKSAGLRLSAAGAGAMSFSYILKMDTSTCAIRYGTLWTSQYKGVESTRVNDILATRNGSVALAGTAYGHLYTTPNHFPMVEGEDWAPGSHANLTILNPKLHGLRFSSVMEGCGKVELGYQENFHLFKGQVGDRELVVAVTGAQDHALSPKLNPLQEDFAGGHLDGHITIFELEDD